MRAAFSLVTWFSRAAGTSTSHCTSRTSWAAMTLAPGKPVTLPVDFLCAIRRSTSRPAAPWIAALLVVTPTTVEPLAAADRERLAGDHRGNREPMLHRDCVHDPGHDLRRRVDVGSGDVVLGTDDHADLGGVAPRHPFQFTLTELLGVDHDAPFGAAER